MADFYIESTTSEAYLLPMEDRVARLEGDMQDVKSLLSRLEPMIIRIDATLTSTIPHLATRAEVATLCSGLDRESAAVRSDMTQEFAAVRSEMKQEFAAVRSEMKQEFAAVRSDMTQEFAAVRSDMKQEFAAVRFDVNRDISGLRLEMTHKLAELPTRTYMLGILGVLITAYAAGLAALAVLK